MIKSKSVRIKNDSHKKSYSRPQLKEIGKVNNITMGTGGGNLDSGNLTPAS